MHEAMFIVYFGLMGRIKGQTGVFLKWVKPYFRLTKALPQPL
jgi:hypothetical protein